MANVYVDSTAGGAATGADWANAYLTLAAAFAAKAAGDDFWVAHDHAESTAGAVALTSPGTIASPCRVICVDSAGTVPPVSADLRTTASISTTGTNNIVFGGIAYYEGITFNTGSGAVTTNISVTTASSRLKFKNCKFVVTSTGAASTIVIGSNSAGAYYEQSWENCTVKFAATGQSINLSGGRFHWRNTASAIDAAGSIPTTLFTSSSSRSVDAVLDGVDLSDTGSGKTLVGALATATRVEIRNCEIDAAVTKVTQQTAASAEVLFTRIAGTGIAYIEERHAYEGAQTDETTIVRTGGATDGTTPKARKIATTANAKYTFPFEATPIMLWNTTTGSNITVTLYGIWGGGAVPNNDDIWLEVQYLGSASNPQASFDINTKADVLATGSALDSDASSWGVGSTTAFKMTATFQPELAGPIALYVKAAAASSTFYIDPEPEISGVTVSRSYVMNKGIYVNERSTSSGGGGVRFIS
jgi:hypothetical protein